MKFINLKFISFYLVLLTLAYVNSVLSESFDATVVKVIDGDTIRISKIVKDHRFEKTILIRLLGIDALEISDNQKSKKDEEFLHQDRIKEIKGAISAKDELLKLIPVGSKIKVKTDKQMFDQYGRLLGYVKTKDGIDVNQYLIQEGFAGLLMYAPNDERGDEFTEDYDNAKRLKKGLWGKEIQLTYRWNR